MVRTLTRQLLGLHFIYVHRYFQWSWKSSTLETRFSFIPGFPLKCTHCQSGFQGPKEYYAHWPRLLPSILNTATNEILLDFNDLTKIMPIIGFFGH